MNDKKHDIVIEACHAERYYWWDIWRYRELFYFLSWRDILVRFKQTIIGIMWVIVRPLLTMIVFVLIFGKLARLPSGGVPYPILVFSAMLPWQFFASSLSDSSNSLIVNSSLISKIYFPRIIIPASSIIVSFVDLMVSFSILLVLMVWYGFMPGWQIVTLPLFILMAFGASFGAGLWLASLNVKYRDFRYIIPFIVQFGLYVSPVGFSSGIIPEKWRLLYSLNPMVGVIDGFRWAILGQEGFIYLPGFILSLILVFLILISGIWYFRKTEKTFADII